MIQHFIHLTNIYGAPGILLSLMLLSCIKLNIPRKANNSQGLLLALWVAPGLSIILRLFAYEVL